MFIVLGEKVRRLRLELRLSQQQLAGKEMTRAFVSLVESGKSTPSPESLRVIAHRLGKPVEYFLRDEDDDDALNSVVALLESAERDFQGEGSAAAQAAYRKLTHALKLCIPLERMELEARARGLSLRCLCRLGRYEDVLEEGDRALDCFKELGDRGGIAVTHFEMGRAALYQEEFNTARRAYEKAALYSAGLKTMQALRAQALLYLGSCLYKLGSYAEAAERYREALSEAGVQDDPALKGLITMSLGWVLYRSGDLEDAYRWTKTSYDSFRESKAQDTVLAHHNLGVIQAARGRWEEAYGIFQSCLQTYRETGRPAKQAAILEDLARYWIQRTDLERAEGICWEAVDLLDLQDDGLVRGRVYRLLGGIAATRGDLAKARDLLRVSLEILRRMKAAAEVGATQEQLEAIQHRMTLSAS